MLFLLLLPEPSPRLLTGGASAKNLPPAGFLNAAGFPLSARTNAPCPRGLRFEWEQPRKTPRLCLLGDESLFLQEGFGDCFRILIFFVHLVIEGAHHIIGEHGA